MCQNPDHWLVLAVLKEEKGEVCYEEEIQFGEGDPHVVGPAIAAALVRAQIYKYPKVVVELLPFCKSCMNPAGVGVSGTLVWQKIPKSDLNKAVTSLILGLLTTLREGNRILHQAKVLADELKLAERDVFGVPPKHPDQN